MEQSLSGFLCETRNPRRVTRDAQTSPVQGPYSCAGGRFEGRTVRVDLGNTYDRRGKWTGWWRRNRTDLGRYRSSGRDHYLKVSGGLTFPDSLGDGRLGCGAEFQYTIRARSTPHPTDGTVRAKTTWVLCQSGGLLNGP